MSINPNDLRLTMCGRRYYWEKIPLFVTKIFGLVLRWVLKAHVKWFSMEEELLSVFVLFSCYLWSWCFKEGGLIFLKLETSCIEHSFLASNKIISCNHSNKGIPAHQGPWVGQSALIWDQREFFFYLILLTQTLNWTFVKDRGKFSFVEEKKIRFHHLMSLD